MQKLISNNIYLLDFATIDSLIKSRVHTTRRIKNNNGINHKASAFLISFFGINFKLSGRKYNLYNRNNHTCLICNRSANYYCVVESVEGILYNNIQYNNYTSLCRVEDNKLFYYNMDHIKQTAIGGKTVWNNLRTACENCNLNREPGYKKHDNYLKLNDKNITYLLYK